MCGITAYFGEKNGIPIVLEGLKRLEYRGYDSAGIAFLNNNTIEIIKTKGKIQELKSLVSDKNSNIVIGHTRWATHGEPNYINAHPHLSMDKSIAIIHNGIIENHSELKRELKEKYNFKFESDTDSEIIAQLIQLAISRRREFMADAGSVGITRQPQGLIAALTTISNDHEPLEVANKATAHLYIVNPFKEKGHGAVDWLAGLFNTHPPLSERIAALTKMV